MLKYFFLSQAKRINRYFRKNSIAKSLTVFSFIAIFSLIAFGIYAFFVAGFSFISIEGKMIMPLLLYFYEIFFLVLGLVIFLSTIVTGMFSLWRGKNDDWFLSSPGFIYLPKLVFIKSIISGIWPLFIVVLPVVLAMNKVFGISILGFFSIILSFFLYLIIVSSLALLLIVLSGKFYYFLSEKISFFKLSFTRLFSFIFLILLITSLFIWNRSLNIDFIELFQANNPDISSVELSSISAYFLYLPSHYIAINTLFSQLDIKEQMFKYLSVLMSSAFVLTYFWWKSSVLFLPLWQKFKEGTDIKSDRNNLAHRQKTSFKFSGSSLNALFKKEFILLSRNPRNLIWFFFLLSIWFIQILINFSLAGTISSNDLDVSLKQTGVQALQFVVATYFISAFVLRFVFPSFSSERKTLWILSSAPINTSKIFYIKYLFYASFFLVFGMLLAYFSFSRLNSTWIFVGETLAMFSVATLFITALGLSLGAIFPNYETDDPGIISTTLPGISLILVSLLYGSSGGLIMYYAQKINNHFPIYLFIISSVLIMAIMLLSAPKLVRSKNSGREMIS